ncbi:MAG: N-6 DNA methylase [Sulfolobales archaeon]
MGKLVPDFLKMFKRGEPKGAGYIRDYVTGSPLKASKEEIRRQFVERRLVKDFGYPKELLGVDVDIEVGGKTLGRADILIFKDPEVRDPINNVFAIVLVKSGSVDDLKKLMSSTSAEYGLLYDQDNFVVLRKSASNVFEEICRFPMYGESFECLERGLSRASLKPATDLATQIDDTYRYVREVEGLSSGKLLDEFLKLLTLKLGDEVIGGDELLAWVSNKEFVELNRGVECASFKSRVDGLIEKVRDRVLVGDGRLNVKSRTIAEFFRRFHNVSILKCGDVSKYEALHNVARQHLNVERGEVLTPHPLADLMVRMLNPSKNDLVLDPACGSGRLIAWVVRHVKHRHNLTDEEVLNFVRNNILCVDVNPDAIKIARTYMVLYAGGVGNTLVANSLAPFDVLKSVGLEMQLPEHLIPGPEKFDVILTHPPFNVKQKVSNPQILSHYELGYKWNYDRSTSKWVKTSDVIREQFLEVLFIERCFQMLKMYGRMAIVLPEEVLAVGALGYVRQWLLQNARIVATVALPHQTFIPYGVKARTFLLVMQKVPKDELEKLKASEYKMFVANLEKVGYDAFGTPIYKKNKDGEIITDESGNPVIDTDVPLICEKFNEFKENEGLTF